MYILKLFCYKLHQQVLDKCFVAVCMYCSWVYQYCLADARPCLHIYSIKFFCLNSRHCFFHFDCNVVAIAMSSQTAASTVVVSVCSLFTGNLFILLSLPQPCIFYQNTCTNNYCLDWNFQFLCVVLQFCLSLAQLSSI